MKYEKKKVKKIKFRNQLSGFEKARENRGLICGLAFEKRTIVINLVRFLCKKCKLFTVGAESLCRCR
jgi:hypothetical protein